MISFSKVVAENTEKNEKETIKLSKKRTETEDKGKQGKSKSI